MSQNLSFYLSDAADHGRINVKLGGINTVPDPRSVPFLTDPNQPTVVMGADVIHPAPGSESRPSFTSLVANVDSDTAKYVAATRVQTSRQEMIEDLEVMAYVRSPTSKMSRVRNADCGICVEPSLEIYRLPSPRRKEGESSPSSHNFLS